VDQEPACGCGQVDGPPEADHDTAAGLEVIEEQQQVPEAATEPVQPEHQHLPDLARAGGGSETVQGGPSSQ
jgi:hypothetical protein